MGSGLSIRPRDQTPKTASRPTAFHFGRDSGAGLRLKTCRSVWRPAQPLSPSSVWGKPGMSWPACGLWWKPTAAASGDERAGQGSTFKFVARWPAARPSPPTWNRRRGRRLILACRSPSRRFCGFAAPIELSPGDEMDEQLPLYSIPRSLETTLQPAPLPPVLDPPPAQSGPL